MFNKLVSLAVATLVSAAPAPDFADPVTVLDLPYKGAFPCDLAVGGDGNLYSFDPVAGSVIQVQPKTNLITAFANQPLGGSIVTSDLPMFDGNPYLPCAVRSASNGDVYAVTGYNNEIIQIKTSNPPAIEIFTLPANLALSDLLPGTPTSFYTGNTSQILEASKGKLTTFQPPTAPKQPSPLPLGLFEDSKGNIWYSTTKGKSVGYFNPSTKSSSFYALPPKSKCEPAYVRAEVGSTLYFTCFNDDAILTLDSATSAIEFIPTHGLPSQETLDNEGTLWYTTTTQTYLVGYGTGTPTDVTEIQLPAAKTVNTSPFTAMVGVQYLPSLNRVYFVQQKYNRIGYLQLSDDQ